MRRRHRKTEKDQLGAAILQRVLEKTGFSAAVLKGDRSPGNVQARSNITAMLRNCVHPECAQLSLRRIGALLQIDASVVRWRINHAEDQAKQPWHWQTAQNQGNGA